MTGAGAGEQVWVAIQRELRTDPAGTVRLGRYTPSTGAWAWLGYPLDAAPAGAWIGLSEVVAVEVPRG
ncbi:esterase-like activity of phytase family protein [Phytohabitans rumicis]|uniref:esterase-like activity of phytase family protein n=1 Tax=Phytohabitans rumicis TaxID=1076125 RepID=UPI001FE6409C